MDFVQDNTGDPAPEEIFGKTVGRHLTLTLTLLTLTLILTLTLHNVCLQRYVASYHLAETFIHSHLS